MRVIGEGSYGCVTNPSIRCSDKSVKNYTNKVSKIMHKKHALQEYKELSKITKIPGIEKFIISMPSICKPSMNSIFHDVIRDCENSKFPKMREDSFRILVFDNGGVNLSEFMKNAYPKMAPKELFIFWTNVVKLIDGLIFFRQKNIIHQDLKAQNIVYNVLTGDMRFIDFGKLTSHQTMIRLCTQSRNNEAHKWFNYPPEFEYSNKNDFVAKKVHWVYSEFLQKMADTFDSYSIGIMMAELIQNRRHPGIASAFLKEAFQLFSEMGNTNLQLRSSDLADFKERYVRLLKLHDMYVPNLPEPTEEILQIAKKTKMISSSEIKKISKLVGGYRRKTSKHKSA